MRVTGWGLPMPCRAILRWPDKRLRDVAAPVIETDDDIRAIWDEMIEVMEAMPGVGLAAPQIGVMRRLAVVDASDTRGQVIRMANPEIVHASVEARVHRESSPNLPGVSAEISRPAGRDRALPWRGRELADPQFRASLGHQRATSDRPFERAALCGSSEPDETRYAAATGYEDGLAVGRGMRAAFDLRGCDADHIHGNA